MRRGTVLFVVLFVVGGPELRAADAVAIKLKQAGQGESLWTDQLGEAEVLMQLASDGNVTEKQSEKTSQRFVFRETVLAKSPKDKLPTRLEREYEKAEITAQGRTQAMPYQGWTVVIEQQDGRYRFRIKGGDELSAADAPFLNREFNEAERGRFDNETFLPKKPVAVGESWQIDAQPLVESFEKTTPLRVNAAKATAAGKLRKVYTRDGRQYGVLSVRVELPLTTYTQGERRIALRDDSRAVIDATVDSCIDGTAVDGKLEIITEVKARGTVTGADGKENQVTLSIKNRGRELRADLPRR